MKPKILIIMTAVFFVMLSCSGQKTEDIVPMRDWVRPENIDPLAANVGDFLEVDLRDYMIKADQAYWQKDYKLAAQNYLYLISHNVYDIISTYNLSCTYALMNQPDLSSKFLFRAVDLGFVDYNYILNDHDFDGVRENKVFKAAIDSIGQMIKNLGDEIVIESKSLMKCRVTKPLGFFPDQKYTMVIGLHGHSSNHNQMVKIWRYFDIPEFIFVVPQAPFNVPIGQVNEFRWNIDEVTQEVNDRSERVSREFVLDVISQMKKNYNVGDIYLLGLHQGSSVAFDVAMNHPEQVRGVIAFGVDYDIDKVQDNILNRAKRVKYFVVNSPNDDYVDHERSIKLKSTLESKGFDHVYLEIDNEYSISRDVLKQSERWFLGR